MAELYAGGAAAAAVFIQNQFRRYRRARAQIENFNQVRQDLQNAGAVVLAVAGAADRIRAPVAPFYSTPSGPKRVQRYRTSSSPRYNPSNQSPRLELMDVVNAPPRSNVLTARRHPIFLLGAPVRVTIGTPVSVQRVGSTKRRRYRR